MRAIRKQYGANIGRDVDSTATCPWCGSTLYGDEERFECLNCEGGVFFIEGGELVDSMHRGQNRNATRNCTGCDLPLDRGELTLAWEDGGNSDAYVTCPHCGYHNVR